MPKNPRFPPSCQPPLRAAQTRAPSKFWRFRRCNCSTSPDHCRFLPRRTNWPLRAATRRSMRRASSRPARRPSSRRQDWGWPSRRCRARTDRLDTLLVAGGPGVHAASADPVVLNWLRRRAMRARRVASVCTGAFLLGAAGLLNGRRAATHWLHCAELARRYPDDPRRIRSDLCPGRRGLDLGRRDGGDRSCAGAGRGRCRPRALARGGAASRDVPQASRRPGAVQHGPVAARRRGSLRRSACLDEAGDLNGDLSLPALARKAGMSERSFSRHYAQCDRHDAGARGRAAAGRGGAAAALRYAAAGEAHRRALRFRLGRDTCGAASAGCWRRRRRIIGRGLVPRA